MKLSMPRLMNKRKRRFSQKEMQRRYSERQSLRKMGTDIKVIGALSVSHVNRLSPKATGVGPSVTDSLPAFFALGNHGDATV